MDALERIYPWFIDFFVWFAAAIAFAVIIYLVSEWMRDQANAPPKERRSKRSRN